MESAGERESHGCRASAGEGEEGGLGDLQTSLSTPTALGLDVVAFYKEEIRAAPGPALLPLLC